MTDQSAHYSSAASARPPAASASPFPLTPVQAGMLYESTLAGRPSINLEQIVIHMPEGRVDAQAMRAAWTALAARHPALRLQADWSGAGGAWQIARPQADFGLAEHDLSRADSDALAAFLAADRAQGADMSTLPNWRLALLHLPDATTALVWTFPHSLLDGRSFSILLEEAFAHYDALTAGLPPAEPPPRPDFAGHCLTAGEPADAETIAHFVEHLDGFRVANELGFGLTPVPAGVASPGKPILTITLPKALTLRLTERVVRAGTTLASALNAVWGLVLARSSGQRHAVFGVTRSGRQLTPRSEEMVGCLINTVPLCVSFDATTTLDALLRQVRSDQFAMRPHEYCPLTAIRTGLGLASDQPLFETMVMYEHETLDTRMRALGGAWAQRRVELHEEGALPLTLAAYGQRELRLRLEYDPDHIASEAAQRYLCCLERLLIAIADAPEDAPLSGLSMLPDAEVEALMRLAHGPVARTAQAPDTGAAVAAMAESRPQAPALIDAEGAIVDFAALEQRVDRLARRLAARGAGPGRVVALCLPRSPSYVVAMLAVLRTGAAFLPLDPAYPPDSLDFMAADSGAVLLLTERIAPWMTGHPAVDLAALLAAGDAEPPALAVLAPDPDRTAYVIYTSGTTGRPKGVTVPHRSLSAHAAAARDLFDLSDSDRVLQFTSLSFDVSIEEILPTLVAGAAVMLRPEGAARDPRLLLDFVAAERITVLNLPTGFWQALLDDMEMSGRRLPASVRLVVAGGERVPPAALRRWRALMPDLPWINGYGPTEATITSAAFTLPAGAALPEGDVPVGRPLSHARAWVMAADGSLAPKGVPGELWIGGPCVAGGYLNRPDLTAQKFVPDPFRPGTRAYRSGDIARWDAEGQLRLAGRGDRQIKLRGFRIEPAEIERVLEGLEGVGQALVAMPDGDGPAARLIAWVRPAVAGRVLDGAVLESVVASRLPPQMRPQIVPVGDWPQRPGGKIDIARLPRPQARYTPAPDHDGGADEDGTTRAVGELFADLLDCGPAAPDAGFFELGGHSLLLIRLIGRIEARFGRRLSVAEVHGSPSPRALARLLSAGGAAHRPLDDCIVPIQPNGAMPPIFGVHVLGVNGSFFRPLAQHLGPDQPIYGLTVGLLDEFTPTGIEETAELYRRVIESHYPRGPLSLVAVSLGSYVALELAQRLLAGGRDVTMLAMLDAEGPGGRPKIARAGRARAHLRLLREEGPAYLLRQAQNKLSDLNHWFEKLKLVLSGRLGRPGASTTSIEEFVAANELAVLAYRPRPYPRRLTIVRARASVFDSDEAIATGLGWARIAAGGFDLAEVAGDHLTILDEPSVGDLARILGQAIRRGSKG